MMNILKQFFHKKNESQFNVYNFLQKNKVISDINNETNSPMNEEIKKCCCEEKIEKIEESVDNLNKKNKRFRK